MKMINLHQPRSVVCLGASMAGYQEHLARCAYTYAPKPTHVSLLTLPVWYNISECHHPFFMVQLGVVCQTSNMHSLLMRAISLKELFRDCWLSGPTMTCESSASACLILLQCGDVLLPDEFPFCRQRRFFCYNGDPDPDITERIINDSFCADIQSPTCLF